MHFFAFTLLLAFLSSGLPAQVTALNGQQRQDTLPVRDAYGAVVRMNPREKAIYLVFTGHEFNEGDQVIRRTLKKYRIRASFFFTGDFMRRYPETVRRLRRAGNYVGAHSDKHLLYCDWTKRDSLFVTRQQFLDDLNANYAELARNGIAKTDAPWFMPPYEWYNDSIVRWTEQAGLRLINFTPGTGSNSDYTTSDLPNYRSSEQIFQRIINREKEDPQGLNGHVLLLHIGAGPKRPDPFFERLDELIGVLRQKGYRFFRL